MKVGLLFPDFGSQHVGMGKELYDTSRLMQEYFEEASHCLNTNFVKLCFASSDVELARIDHAYASLFLMSSAIGTMVLQSGIKPVAIAGFGVGEFAALQFAQSLSLPDGLYFLSKYAQFYQQIIDANPLRSLHIQNCDIRSIKKYCSMASSSSSVAAITAYLSNKSALVAGHVSAVDKVACLVKESGGSSQDRPIDGGMHSSIMLPISEALDMYAEKIDINDARFPVISCVDGMARTKGDSLSAALLQQVTAPVRWDKIMAHVAAWDVILEIGPGSTLTKLIKSAYPTKQIYTINRQSDMDELALIVAGQQPDDMESNQWPLHAKK